ncbi:putative heavy metal tolerance protein precursor [Podospora fimiseda]|uniref:Heavy metal tolerance protein n=1 Tax=Podospora fimiseda TaxID=252190 RepID=A0AAN7BXS7_9PEZI|nr:putative heavy metal tolerance protein precursor [Podospora fimiseda]
MDALSKNSGPVQSLTTAQMVYLKTQLFSPVVLLLVFVITAGIHSVITARSEEEFVHPTATGPGGKPLPVTKRKREQREAADDQESIRGNSTPASSAIFKYLTGATILSFLINGFAIGSHISQSAKQQKTEGVFWWCGEERVVYVVGSAFLWLYILISLFEWRDSPSIVHAIFWFFSTVGEVIILSAFTVTVTSGTYLLEDGNKSGKPTQPDNGLDGWDAIDLAVGSTRLFLIVLLVFLYTVFRTKSHLKARRALDEETNRSDSDESTPLLNGNQDSHGRSRQNPDYSSTNSDANGTSNEVRDQGYPKCDEEAAFYRPEKLPHKTWFEYCRGYSVFFPYLWPSDSVKLKCTIFVCFVLVIAQRIVNILVPAQIGIVMKIFADISHPKEGENPKDLWFHLGLLMVFKLLQGNSGLLGSLRSIFWVDVSQHTYLALTTSAFEHVHWLSLDFHLGKRTGEVLSALNKGASINQFLEQVTFQVLPMLIDLLAAILYFYAIFGPIYALFATIMTFYYLYLTIRMAATRADQRRDMVNADREEEAVKNDSITSYETVKYFNAEPYEFKRYRGAIKTFQEAEAKVTWGINIMNMAQTWVFMTGFFVSMGAMAYQVSEGQRDIGDFTTLLMYLGQLQGPLNFFGTFYRTVQQAMISGERLLELFKIRPTVVDRAGVLPLYEPKGHIKWTNVGFSYDKRRTALEDLSFECKPGTTTAFVGESGGGKSTVFRLMFRYYDSQEGKIEMDGQDVKDLTIDSVRRAIGVVPQDTILFNETLMYNLKYANPSATDEEVYEACRSASIHDRIMSFPDGYDTKVGERGLRLSGGEKQRVAIARTILKDPKIIMLDEATSALDGETEQKIQSKLIGGKFGQDRTVLIIAHRLSTITHADQIIVMHAGSMVEKGTHEELLALKGRYASMWEKHCRAEQAAEHARDATRKAKKLMCQANLSRGDDGSDGYTSMASSALLPTSPNSPAVSAREHDDSSEDSHSSASTLGDEDEHSPCQHLEEGAQRNGERRPLLYSFPSGTTAGYSTEAPNRVDR